MADLAAGSGERFAALVRETPADWLTRRLEMMTRRPVVGGLRLL